ncbi:hypothetical protein AX769_11150 [Frondihabitans sp. PAMC 28766]|uniref:hypothetical protein n=1 Tax=Frondihabitans sp. PAMC 28766 TaxID=1795630 RepID=UPI00078D896C|nr:hypothetical protein [Frondihabitans sp. PAMC 28766]AMM20594.1 hypothetical protein AX769_11150 [Frondihabitans sp. PAMC 28766]
MATPSPTGGFALAHRIEARADGLWRTLRIDRLAGGRQRAYIVREDMRRHPMTVRAFKTLRWLLLLETLVGVTAIVIAVSLTAHGVTVGWAVWFRATVVLMITLSIYVFAWRAQLGYYWAYSRMKLFSRIFPVVTVVIALIPGLYPEWMVVEQLIFSGLMVVIAVLLSTAHLRAVFPRPPRRSV